MTNNRSPYQRIRSLELELSRRMSDEVASELLPTREADELRRLMTLATSTVRQWDVAEVPSERIQRAKIAHKQIADAENNMLRLSQYDIFSPVDVAEYSVAFGYIMDALITGE